MTIKATIMAINRPLPPRNCRAKGHQKYSKGSQSCCYCVFWMIQFHHTEVCDHKGYNQGHHSEAEGIHKAHIR